MSGKWLLSQSNPGWGLIERPKTQVKAHLDFQGGGGSFPINRTLLPLFRALEVRKLEESAQRLKKIGKSEESIQRSNTVSFNEDNKHIECDKRVPSPHEDQRLTLIEIKPSRPSLKTKLIQIQQGHQIRGSCIMYSIEMVPTHSCLIYFWLEICIYSTLFMCQALPKRKQLKLEVEDI